MADEADNAYHQEQLSLAISLRQRKQVLTTIGACWYCDSSLGSGLLFCDSFCAQDYEREDRLKRIAGKA